MDEPRTAQIKRITNETKIDVSINLDAYPGNSFGVKQEINVSTGIGFLDHVRVSFFRLKETHMLSFFLFARLSYLWV